MSSMMFPLNAVPSLIADSVKEVHKNTQAPIPLIFGSALTALSIANQGIFDIRQPSGITTPCSLQIFTIAASGERKTTVDRIYSKPIREHEKTCRSKYQENLRGHKASMQIWDQKLKALEKNLGKLLTRGVSTQDIEEQITQHILSQPRPPTQGLTLFEDITPAAMVRQLSAPRASAGLISSEGATILNSSISNSFPILSKMWDGDTHSTLRVGGGEFSIEGARLTVSIMVQPETFLHFLKVKKGIPRDNGFLGRGLFAYPQSTQGFRFNYGEPTSSHHTEALLRRIDELIIDADEIRHSLATPKTMLFSAGASRLILDFYNNVEHALGPAGGLHDIRDFASKIANNAARIAGIFQYTTTNSFLIEDDAIYRAIEICYWYISEFKDLFGARPALPPEVEHARMLQNWFAKNVALNQTSLIYSLQQISQFGPNQLRSNKAARDAALNVLQMENKIKIAKHGGRTQVMINPAWFLIQPHQAGQSQLGFGKL